VCTTLDNPCPVLGKSSRAIHHSVKKVCQEIRTHYVMVATPEALKCLAILQETHPDITFYKLAMCNSSAIGAARYNPFLSEKVVLTKENNTEMMQRITSGVFTEITQDPTPRYDIMLEIRTNDIPDNIVSITKLLMELSNLKLVNDNN